MEAIAHSGVTFDPWKPKLRSRFGGLTDSQTLQMIICRTTDYTAYRKHSFNFLMSSNLIILHHEFYILQVKLYPGKKTDASSLDGPNHFVALEQGCAERKTARTIRVFKSSMKHKV